MADAPAKDDVLALLDEVRAETERGDVLALVVIPIHPDMQWSTRSAGDIGMLNFGGILGRAWLTAMEAVGNEGRKVR